LTSTARNISYATLLYLLPVSSVDSTSVTDRQTDHGTVTMKHSVILPNNAAYNFIIK